MESIWKKDVKMPVFPRLEENVRTETAVIGGGMTGLLCGYFLKQQGADYLILEKDRIAGGVTQNTTAKITAYHGLIYSGLIRKYGEETASAYLRANTEALEQYRKIAEAAACEFEETDQWIYTTGNPAAVCRELEAVEKIGGKAFYREHLEIPIPAVCGMQAPGQAQFHPLKFAAAAAAGQRIFEDSSVADVKRRGGVYDVTVRGKDGKLRHVLADRVIVATHFPFMDRRGLYFMKLYQNRSYAVAVEPENMEKIQKFSGMYIGIGKEAENPLNLSFRTCGSRIILGGGGGRTGADAGDPAQLLKIAEMLYPGSRIAAVWAAQDCMSLDGMPYIGAYAGGDDRLMTASGFNKWGMTGAMTAAMALTGRLPEELTEIFRTDRSMMHRQLLVNLAETARNFLRISAPRCSHLGCALNWNRAEKTWDCPCHGSRFTEKGHVIDGPAQNTLKLK